MRRLQRYTVALGAVLAATIGWAAGASAQEFTMKLAHHYPDAHIQAAGLRTFVSEVEKNSGGRIKIQVFPAESLVSGREALEAVEGRVVDAAPMSGNFQTGSIPMLEDFTYPFMFDNAQHFHRAVDGGIYDLLKPEYAKRNILLANYYHKGALHIFHKSKFLNTPDAYQGERIRSLGSSISALLSAMGANPLNVPLGEVDAAIERNVISGITTNCAAHLSRGWYEGLRYATFMDFSQGGEGLGINMDFYNSLPEDLQKVVMDAAKVMQDEEWTSMIEDDEVSCFKKWADAGVEVHKLTDDERKAIVAYMAPIMADAVAKRPEIQTFIDIAEKTK